MILENAKNEFKVLVAIDNEYFWIVTSAASKDAAKRNANAVAAIRFANKNSVRLASYLTAKNHMIKITVDDEINIAQWKQAKPLRSDEKGTQPELNQTSKTGELSKRTERFMDKYYGNSPSGVISADFDMPKLIKLAKTSGFSEIDMKDHEFQATVNAYLYSRLK